MSLQLEDYIVQVFHFWHLRGLQLVRDDILQEPYRVVRVILYLCVHVIQTDVQGLHMDQEHVQSFDGLDVSLGVNFFLSGPRKHLTVADFFKVFGIELLILLVEVVVRVGQELRLVVRIIGIILSIELLGVLIDSLGVIFLVLEHLVFCLKLFPYPPHLDTPSFRSLREKKLRVWEGVHELVHVYFFDTVGVGRTVVGGLVALSRLEFEKELVVAEVVCGVHLEILIVVFSLQTDSNASLEDHKQFIKLISSLYNSLISYENATVELRGEIAHEFFSAAELTTVFWVVDKQMLELV